MFLRIGKPKMRWLTARREFVLIEDPGTTRLAVTMLKDVARNFLVWPLSPAAWRQKHNALTSFFGISTEDTKGLTPASLRGGGATFLFRRTRSADVVRWRGRWQTHRSGEIYVQEVMAPEVTAAVVTAVTVAQQERRQRQCSNPPFAGG